MNESVYSFLRLGRNLLQIGAEPIDHASRVLNNRRGYPPMWIRQKVGGLNDFEGSGGEYMAYLKLLCNLKPGNNVLDIGCGCGLMCLPVNENGTLPEYIYPGIYWGWDISKEMIDWCNRHIKGENIEFSWVGEDITLVDNGPFDVILAKSLFTHLQIKETKNYLEKIKRLLKPGGRCLATFFLMTGTEPKGRYTFKYQGDTNAYYLERLSKPEAAVAYNEGWLLPYIKMLGFSYDVHHGSWRGDNKGLSFQDIIILRR